MALLNYGAGNLRNVKRCLESAGASVELLEAEDFKEKSFDAIILPGVGAFGSAMERIGPIKEKLATEVNNGTYVLGICLGLQLVFSSSTEAGQFGGLDLIRGKVAKLPTAVKIPQIGWNTITVQKDSPLLEDIADNSYFYFVHSYVAKPKESKVVIASTNYGTIFPSIIASKNIFATQFHPEKSGKIGIRLVENFVNIVRR